MKLFVALTSILAFADGKNFAAMKKKFANRNFVPGPIKADSPLGNTLMTHARRVDEEVDITWVAGFSLKFQGCHHISQWNAEADGEDDVRIETKRLVRFRLCPSSDCTEVNAGGCSSGYGEYIIDMNIFIESYFDAVENYYEYECQYLAEVTCDCENANDDEKCEYDCYVENGMETICADNDPYADDQGEEEEEFDLQEYIACERWEPANNGRRLDQDEVEYYMGPYCAEGGGSIFLGIFTDDTCTTFADEDGGKTTYETAEGKELPYGEVSIIGMECISCKEPAEVDENNQNDADDADEVIEFCEEIYQQAGKCETNLGADTGRDLNVNACNYMEGIKIVRQNGVINQKSTSANKTASIFIGVFVVAFVLLAAYVYFLKTKLDRASINLSE